MKNKMPKPLAVTVLILICAVVVSASVVFGLYAKYIVGSDGGDSARVAKFVIEDSGDMFEQSYAIEIDPTNTESTPVIIEDALTLTNNSEVAVSCELTVESVAELPLIFTWVDENDDTVGSAAANSKVSTDMPPNHNTEKTYDLYISWDDTEENKLFTYRRQVDSLTLNVQCVQID